MKYYTTPPGDIIAPSNTHKPPTTTHDGQTIINALALLGVGVSPVSIQIAPQIINYHFNLYRLKDYPKIKRALPTLSAVLRSPVMLAASTVGHFALTVPRSPRELVTLHEVINTHDYNTTKMSLPVAMGISSNNLPVIFDLAAMPHLLIAGTTGGGKSVLLNTIISSILFRTTPNKCRLLMIDPKRVEFSPYNGLPHLFAPVATETDEILYTLKELCRIMDDRYKLFEQTGIKDIKQSNLPRIVLVVDELADLIMTGGGEAGDYLIRLAQKSRAAGIHLIIATQRPTREVLPGLLCANIPAKIALKTASIRESVIILDHKGAETLTGGGDAFLKLPDRVEEIRFQAAYTSTKDVEAIVNYWKNNSISEE